MMAIPLPSSSVQKGRYATAMNGMQAYLEGLGATVTWPAVAAPAPTPVPAPVVPSPATGRFYVVGKDVVGPDGRKFFPVGANVGITGSFDWKGTSEKHSADALRWGWNTVRLNLDVTDLASWSYVAHNGLPALLAEVAAMIAEYTAQKIVVIVTCHDDTFGTPTWAATAPKIKAFWAAFAPTVKANPYVWFNPVNEAFWAQTADWQAFCADYYTFLRGLGCDNIIVFDLLESGEDAAWWTGQKYIYDPTMGPAFAAGKCNVLWSMHNYGTYGTAAEYVDYFTKVQAAGLPLIIGEYGYSRDTPKPFAVTAADAIQTAAAKLGIGSLWWHATHGDGYYLHAAGAAGAEVAWYDTTLPLSVAGQKLWDFGHATHDLGPFTGDITASRCASALKP